MKKSMIFVFAMAIFVFSFLGCRNNEKALTLQIKNLEHQNTILAAANENLMDEIKGNEEKIFELNTKIQDLVARLTEIQVAQKTFNLGEECEIYDLNFDIDFSESECNVKLYDSVDSFDSCYELQKGDVIHVYKFIKLTKSKNKFIWVSVSNGMVGYVYINSDPFINNDFVNLEQVDVEGKMVEVLKFNNKVKLYEASKIKILPIENCAVLYTITLDEGSNDYFDCNAITADYKWIRVSAHEITGWLPVESIVSDDIKEELMTPDKIISLELLNTVE